MVRTQVAQIVPRAGRRPAPQGEPFILEATFVPLPAFGCFYAAVRRALAFGGWPPRIFAGVIRPRALLATNWDSNAVLCGT